MTRKNKYFVGIDEVGRGPIAGPVAVCALVSRQQYNFRSIKGLNDSKKLSPKDRERIFEVITGKKVRGELDYRVSMVSPGLIDKKGISWAIKTALARALVRLELDCNECHVFLDGSLRAPIEYLSQETIIGGDGKVAQIAMASIMAKVLRDRKMKKIAQEHSLYGFERNMGYGTKNHYNSIKKYGLLDIHRRSFLGRL